MGTPTLNFGFWRFKPLRHGFAVPPRLKQRQYAAVTIGFSSRRSCHEVTDEVKFCGLMSFSARNFIISKENAPFLNGASVCKIK